MGMSTRAGRGRIAMGAAGAGLLLTVAACSGAADSPGSSGAAARPGTAASTPGQTGGQGASGAQAGQGAGGQGPDSTASAGKGSEGTGLDGKGAAGKGADSAGTNGNGNGNGGSANGGGDVDAQGANRAPRFTPGGVDPEISREAEAGAGGRSIALTIDDGPDARYTPQMLDLLKQHNAKATFCMLGPAAKAHPDLVKRVVAEGHRLCNHSMSHNVRQSDESVDYNRNEITEANRLIREAAGPGAKVWYYRAPGGDFKPWIREIAVENGLRPLGWNADPGDWKREGADKILDSLKQQIKPGRVVLLHDGGGDRSESVTALEGLLDYLDAQGYTYSFPKA